MKKHYIGDIKKDHVPKLDRVMERLDITDYDYDWSTNKNGASAWISFVYKGQYYRFEHSAENTADTKYNLTYVSDVFIQLVYSLEKIAWIIELGIYDLQTWVKGLSALPPGTPEWVQILGFEETPTTVEAVKVRYKMLVKGAHPDAGGSNEGFLQLKTAAEQACGYFDDIERGGHQ